MSNRAIVFNGPGEVLIQKRERPVPEAGEVLVETRRSLVSTGTELTSPRGETSLDFHDYCNGPGYEIVGAHERTHPPQSTPREPWSAGCHRELFFDLLATGEVETSNR